MTGFETMSREELIQTIRNERQLREEAFAKLEPLRDLLRRSRGLLQEVELTVKHGENIEPLARGAAFLVEQIEPLIGIVQTRRRG